MRDRHPCTHGAPLMPVHAIVHRLHPLMVYMPNVMPVARMVMFHARSAVPTIHMSMPNHDMPFPSELLLTSRSSGPRGILAHCIS